MTPQQRQSNLFDSVTEPMATLSLELRIQWANKAAGEVVNRDPESLVGCYCYRVWHDRESPCEDCPVQRTIRTGEPQESEMEAPRGRHLNVRSYPLRSPEGALEEVAELALDITERKRTEEELREREQKYRSLFENMRDAILLADTDREIFDCNPAFESLFEYSLSEIKGQKTSCVYEDENEFQKLGNALREQCNESSFLMTVNYKKKHGEVFPGETAAFSLKDRTGKLVGYVGVIRDISSRNQAEEALRKREDHLQAILQATPDPLVVYDRVGQPQYINPSFSKVFGWSFEELQGKRIPFVPENQKELTFSKIREIYHTGVPVTFDTKRLTKDNRLLDIRVSAAIIRSSLEEHYGLVVILTDITERKQLEEKLKGMSIFDSLTGLYNRNFFEEEMKRLSDGRHNPLGIIVCDLDGLKFINDTLGHQSGDQMLITIGDILRQNFRSSDIIARIGGDEFAALLTETDPDVIEQMLQRLRQAVEDYNSADPELPLSLSMGHAVSEGGAPDMQVLFREADNRMYREKIQREGSARSSILQALTGSMQARDFNTQGHCDRLQELAISLARSLDLSQDFVNDLFLLARFHDLGKVGVPDHILFKPGALTEEQWRQMRQHCEIGHRIASSVPDLEPIADLILKHHERWDGRGYPLGLSGTDIPLSCRILAIIDAYDAMTSDRPYRKALTSQEAIAELKRCAGTQFDPELVERFLRILG